MFLLPNKYTQLTPSPLTPVKGFAMRKGGHGSFGFGKHLPNDRRFGFVICRENPLRISRKLLPMMFKSSPSWHDRSTNKKVWFIQTTTQLLCLEIHRTSLEILTLDSWQILLGAMAGGLEKVLYNVHNMNEKPCTMIRGASSVTSRVDRSDSPTSEIVKPECPPVLFLPRWVLQWSTMEGGALLLGFFQEVNEWLVNGLHPTLKRGYIRVRTHLLAIY